MPTLRERVRDALSAREPGPRDATADLDAILDRARAQSRSRVRMLAYAAALASVTTVGSVAWLAIPKSTPIALHPSPPPQSRDGVHLYIRVVGEPEERALALDLTFKRGRQ